jgi:hypothetical protein
MTPLDRMADALWTQPREFSRYEALQAEHERIGRLIAEAHNRIVDPRDKQPACDFIDSVTR